MKIIVTGSHGFIGSRLVSHLRAEGHHVTPLVRKQKSEGFFWDPRNKQLDKPLLEGFDAVVHLAGESISGRWTASKKKEIYSSRVDATNFLVGSLLDLKSPPKIFISASAIGIYGNREDELLTENSQPGGDFLASVCVGWEKALDPLRNHTRVASLRTGLLLHPSGGAMKQLLLPTKLGLGGPIGSGKQYWSWLSMDDMISMYSFILTNEDAVGSINAVSVNPIHQKDFQRTLSEKLNRPSFIPLPSFAVKLLLGEMGASLLLSSQRVVPQRLEELGYRFRDTNLKSTLERML